MAHIGNQPFGKTVRTVTTETLASVKTQFYPTGGYTVGYVDAYLNGVRLTETEDFTATNGTLVTLTFNPLIGDTVDIVSYGTVELANAIRRDGDTLVGTLYTRALIPTSNITYDIGSSTMRYKDLYLSGNTINLGDIKLSTNGTAFSVANATGGVFPSALGNTTVTGSLQTTDTITVGNSTVNSIIHTTGITANGAGIHSINATSIATGTLDTARLPATANISTAINVGANVNLTTSTISVGNSTVNTFINSSGITANGANINSVNAASVGGNTASDLRSHSNTIAGTAYSNAVSYASNATNISTGTLNIARISDGAVTAAKLASTAITDKLGYTPANMISFSPVLRFNNWSRLFRMAIGPLWAGAIVTISHTRNSVVHGSTHFVGGGHSGGATIAQLGSHYYSQVQVGIESDGVNDWWFVVYDNAYNVGGSNENTWSCTVIPLMGSVTNIYTSFTAGSGTNRASYTTTNGGTGTNATSDARFKTELQSITNAVDKVKLLNGYTFMKQGDPDRDVGLLAQEVLNVLPEAVTGFPPSNVGQDVRQQILDSESYVLGLKYGQMSALFVEAIKEQQQQIDVLKDQIQALQG